MLEDLESRAVRVPRGVADQNFAQVGCDPQHPHPLREGSLAEEGGITKRVQSLPGQHSRGKGNNKMSPEPSRTAKQCNFHPESCGDNVLPLRGKCTGEHVLAVHVPDTSEAVADWEPEYRYCITADSKPQKERRSRFGTASLNPHNEHPE